VISPSPAVDPCSSDRYDPSAHISDNIDTESARVAFLSTIAQVMAAKGRILLKTKALYAADGRAVKELLKIAKTLHTCVCD
jgi:clusterin-associated protein 1